MKKSELKDIIRECLEEAMTPMEKKEGLRRHLGKKGSGQMRASLGRFADRHRGESATELDTLKRFNVAHSTTRSKSRGKRPKGGY